MRTYTKRCISLLLAIVMLTSLLSMPTEAIEYWRTGAARIDPSMLENENSYELELYPVHNEYELQTVPGIYGEPQSVSAPVGTTVYFYVAAYGTGTISYQWQYQVPGSATWANVTAAAGKTALYSLTVQARHDQYKYRCRVTNSSGTAVSKTAVLSVVEVPKITAEPTDVSATIGKPATFSVTASGNGMLTYQWQYSTDGGENWINVTTNGRARTYTISSVAARHLNYLYRCEVSLSGGGSVTSDSARLVSVPVISISPASKTASVGETVTFTSSVTGGVAPYTYRWQYRTSSSGAWTNISTNGTGANYTLTAAARHNGYQYRCTVTDKNGNSATSGVSSLYVDDLKINITPVTATVTIGKTATFTSSVTGGTAPYSYRWQYRTSASGTWTNISSNGTGASYSVTVALRHNGYQYRCTVTDKNGNSATSGVSTLYADDFRVTVSPASKTVYVGETATFTTSVTGGTSPYSYRWQYRTSASGTWTNVSTNGTGASYSVTAALRHNGYQYRCTVTDKNGNTATSVTTTLNVQEKPNPLSAAITPSSNQYVTEGDSVTLKATASGGAGGYTYKWFRAETSGATGTQVSTSQTYKFTASTAYDGYYYYCQVTDSDGDWVNTSKIRVFVDALITRLPKPTGVAIDAVTNNAVSVRFNAVSGASGYYMYYSTSNSFSTSLSRVEADKSTLVGYVDGLSSGKTYYFWIVAYDASGTLGYESASASTITASVSTPVLTEKNTGTRFYDGQIYDWNMSSIMLLQFSATNGNGDFEVRAFGMSKAPAFNETDVNYSTEFYYPGSGEGNEVWNESSLSGFGGALPFGAPAKSETKYIKIWIRARDKNYSVNNASSAGVQFGIKIVSETTVMLMMPVVIQDSWVQNTFGVYRNTSKLHFGNDLAATANTTIKSARGGTVTAVGSDSSRGNYVIVKDEKYDLYYHYMHMISTAVVSTGQKVSMGTVLGYVGSTGNSTGNHLHFEVTYQTSSLTAGTRELNTNHRTRGDQTNWQYFPSSAYIRTSVREYSSLAAAIAAFKSVDIGFRLDYID